MSAAMTFPPYHGYIDDPEGLKTVIVGTVLPAIATVMVLLRFIIRYTSKAGIGADDITIALVLVSSPCDEIDAISSHLLILRLYRLWSGLSRRA